jgi:hypothetical protein
MKRQSMLIGVLSVLCTTQLFAANVSEMAAASDDYTQSIHVVNLLANDTISEPGMTPTGIIVKYFNGNTLPCWTNTLNYRDDVTIHAGPRQGCINKVNQIVITPVLVADKLKTYLGSVSVDIDTSKFANYLTIIQKQAPSFDTQSGMVVQSGSMDYRLQ